MYFNMQKKYYLFLMRFITIAVMKEALLKHFVSIDMKGTKMNVRHY